MSFKNISRMSISTMLIGYNNKLDVANRNFLHKIAIYKKKLLGRNVVMKGKCTYHFCSVKIVSTYTNPIIDL